MATKSVFLQSVGHERRLFRADRMAWLVAGLLAVAVALALTSGLRWVERQSRAVAVAQADEAARLAKLRTNLQAMDEGRFTPPSAFLNPANPLWVGHRHGAHVAVLPPTALAATAVGQSDLAPPYAKVSAEGKETFALDDEIENPSNLLIGQFDLAFFIVLLLPLAIIALSYDALSGEREQGTLALALANPVRLASLLAGKLAYRAALVVGSVVLALVAGLLLAGLPMDDADALARLAWWVLLVAAYAVLWFAIGAAVGAAGRGSAYNALVLTGVWVALALVVPALLSVAVSVALPAPSRAEMINRIRTVQTEADKAFDANAARFAQEHADMAAPGPGLLAPADAARALRRLEVQQLAAERVSALMAQFDARLARQQRAVDALRFLSPAIVMQQGLNDVAGTGTRRQQRFAEQVDAFHRQWQGFFAPKVRANAALTMADLDTLPRFAWKEDRPAALAASLLPALAGLLVPAALVLVVASRRLARYPVRGD